MSRPTTKRLLSRSDRLLIAILAGIGLILTAIIYLPSSGSAGSTVQVMKDGKAILSLPLDKPADKTIKDDNGNLNRFIIENGSVTMKDANCHDHTCVKSASIRTPGQTIVCLPHRLVIRIAAGDSDNTQKAPDAVVR